MPKHTFMLLNHNEEIDYDSTNKVDFDDYLYNYIKDTFNWFETRWTDGSIKKGFDYYGESRMNNESILKLKVIMESWMNTFKIAPDEFTLTTDYNLATNKFEKMVFSRESVLGELERIVELCKHAILYDKDIGVIGI